MKRFLSILLAALLVSGSFATVSFAADNEYGRFDFRPNYNAGSTQTYTVETGTEIHFTWTSSSDKYFHNGEEVTPEFVYANGKNTPDNADENPSSVVFKIKSGKNEIYSETKGGSKSYLTVIYGVNYNKNGESLLGDAYAANFGEAITDTTGAFKDRTGVVSVNTSSAKNTGITYIADVIEFKYDFYLESTNKSRLLAPYLRGTNSEGAVAELAGSTTYNLAYLEDDVLAYAYNYTTGKSYPIKAKNWYSIKYYVDNKTKSVQLYAKDITAGDDAYTLVAVHNNRYADYKDLFCNRMAAGVANTWYIDNFELNEVTTPSISVTTDAEEGVMTGAKVGATVNGLSGNLKAVYYLDGIQHTLTTTNGEAFASLPDNYSTLSFAVVDGAGDTVKNMDFTDIVTDEKIYKVTGISGGNTPTVYINDDFSKTGDKQITIPAASISPSDADEEAAIARFASFFNYTTDAEKGSVLNLHYDILKNTYYADTDGNTSLTKTETHTTEKTNNSPSATIGSDINDVSDIGIIRLSADFKVTGNPNRASESTYLFVMKLNNKIIYPVRIATTSETKLTTFVYKDGASTETAHADIDVRKWHNYKIEIDPDANKMWIWVDDVLINSGDAYSAAVTSIGATTIYTPRAYSTRTADDQLYDLWYDNIKYESVAGTYAIEAPAAIDGEYKNNQFNVKFGTAALKQITDDVAIIAVKRDATKTEDSVTKIDIKKYTPGTEEYKTFGFDNAEINEIFVWDWSTLKPLKKAITK